ncbi:polysaccharide deacetylase family protein [Clostridium tyrobutyricum]|uniref:polysaccharide deacetylase family protein n=1 Tax=Clostridium tyrobutyricum TaxID=1519 RepID=UPI00073D4396|nr:polysaccharide deacetylase family protein [Clostridium tyrobutyricum]
MNKRGLKIIIGCIIIVIGLLGLCNILKPNFLQDIKSNSTISNKNNIDKSLKVVDSNDYKIPKEREFTGEVIYNNSSVPVLMFHSIDYEKGNELRIPKDAFREKMKFLKDSGYTTLTLNEFYKFIEENKPVSEKSVLITFDDGYEDNYTNAYPVLKEFGLHATIFVITSTVDKDSGYLTSNQLREMNRNGIDIESHTVNHDDLDKLSYEKQLETLRNSKESLENILNKKIDYIAYPFGHFNQNTIKAVQVSGYKMAFTTESGWGNKSQGIYKLHRVYVSANHNINEFMRRLKDPEYDIHK